MFGTYDDHQQFARTWPTAQVYPHPTDRNRTYCLLEAREEDQCQPIQPRYNASIRRVKTSKCYCLFLLPRRPRLLITQSSMRGSGFDDRRTKYCRSRQVKLRLASRAKASIPAAIGADAEVPVCWFVQAWKKFPGVLRSVVMTEGCQELPLEYVVVKVEEHSVTKDMNDPMK